MKEPQYIFDVFISHASEDKEDFVRALACQLVRLGLRVWYDETTLKLGDSLRRRIDEGLASSAYGVVVLSPSFFKKNWPKVELDGLAQREVGGQKVILPVYHDITPEDVRRHSPLLADRVATFSHRGTQVVALQILEIARPALAKARSNDQKKASAALTVSLPKTLLYEIDARARSLGLPRSAYLAALARHDINRGSSLTIPQTSDVNQTMLVDLTPEAVEFLKIAIPTLAVYEKAADDENLPEPPEPLADSELWGYFLKERDEILDYKWLKSHELGKDIGMDRAIREWLQEHHALWAAAQQPPPAE